MMSTKPTRITPCQHSANAPRASSAARAMVVCLTAVVVFIASTAFFVYYGLASNVQSQSIDIAGLGANQSGGTDQEVLPDKFGGRALNILLMGSDSREGEGNAQYGSDVEGMRSDTTMVMHISADRSHVEVVSIPRDLMVDIPSCTRSDGSVSDATYGQFNAAMTIGANGGYDAAGGVACVKSTVEELTGLTVDGFALIDFNGFTNMVDALGGVWYDPGTEPVYDADAGLDLPAGCQKLTGTQALAYARARYGLDDGSDISRISRQQKLVSAMFRELLSKNFVTDMPALMSFVNQTLSSMQVSTNLSDLTTDIGLLLSLSDIERSQIQLITMPVIPDPYDANRRVADEPAASDVWEALDADQPLPTGVTVTTGEGQEGTLSSSGVVSPSPSSTDPFGQDDGFDPAPSVTDEPSPTPSASVAQCPPEE